MEKIIADQIRKADVSTWKKIKVIHSVIGPYAEALRLTTDNRLVSSVILSGAVSR